MSGPAPHFETREACRVFRSASGAGIRALDGVSLTIPRGAFVTITGPSGGGKTTLLALLAALDRPTGGSVHFDSIDLARASEAARARVRRRLGVVFQQFHALRGLPLRENVACPLVPRGVPLRARRRIGDELLARVGLAGRGRARPEELSGGEQERAGIARALAGDPEALLADEPTSDLDRDSARGIVALFRQIHDAGRTVIVVTHDVAFQPLATIAIALRAGRLAP